MTIVTLKVTLADFANLISADRSVQDQRSSPLRKFQKLNIPRPGIIY